MDVSGTFTDAGESAELTPAPLAVFNIHIEGTFAGNIRLERALPGTGFLPFKSEDDDTYTFTSPVTTICIDAGIQPEAGVRYRLVCSGLISGSASYRLSQ